MPLMLPQLDDRTYADLLEEARALIPSLYPEWTDHNPSDPGITLIELFAWLTEMLIYRSDQIPARYRLTFLKLLNGPDRDQSLIAGADMDEAARVELLRLIYDPAARWDTPAAGVVDAGVRATVAGLRRRDRAVTCQDYEALALAAAPGIARARCVPRRYLGAGTEADRQAPRAGHTSVIIVPDSNEPAPQPSPDLQQAVWDVLDPIRTLTTRHHVVGPTYAPVSAEILVARRADVPQPASAAVLRDHPDQVPDTDLRKAIIGALNSFLSPLDGGSAGGWPFGRDVYVSELYELLERVPGVDYVPDIAIASMCPPAAAHCVVADPIWHDEGDLIGLRLAEHHLPWAQIDPTAVVVAVRFAPVQVIVTVVPAAPADLPAVRRAVKAVVRQLLHPLHGGPDGTASKELTPEAIQTEVLKLRALVSGAVVELRSDEARVTRNDEGRVVSIHIAADELVDAQVTVLSSG